MVFMPKDEELRERCRAAFETTLGASGMKLLCWRKVPTRNDEIGHTAKMAEVRVPAPVRYDLTTANSVHTATAGHRASLLDN